MSKRPVTILFGSRAKQEIEQARAWWGNGRRRGGSFSMLAITSTTV
jgi:hypothetical protein